MRRGSKPSATGSKTPGGRMREDGLGLGGGDALRVGFRFRRIGGDVWFGLHAGDRPQAVFSGLVSTEWPAQLREMAAFVEQRLKEAERFG